MWCRRGAKIARKESPRLRAFFGRTNAHDDDHISNVPATVVANEVGRPAGPWAIERAVRDARASVPGLPTGFRFHDLRHYFASLLIADGLDVKTVQARLRHTSAKTTLDVYRHMWPDKDEASRPVLAAPRTSFRCRLRPGAVRAHTRCAYRPQ